MHFNTSALITMLRSNTPSLEAFQAHLDEASILSFSPLDETENNELHQMLGVQTLLPPATLFFVVLFSTVTQNTVSGIPAQLLIATLNKLHALRDVNLIICLVNAINWVAALPTTQTIQLPDAPKLAMTNPTIKRLKLNLLELIKTMRVNEIQIEHALHFDRENTDWTAGFGRFLTETGFNWEEDETALISLLPNDEGLFTALGFLHGLHYTLKQSIEPEKVEAYLLDKTPTSPIIIRNVNITILALKRNLPHPVPFMLPAHENTTTISEHMIVTTFLSPELTHHHLLTLAHALRPFNTTLTEYTFNQRLLRAASEAPIVTDEKKPAVLTDHFGWDPNQTYTAKTATGNINLGNFMMWLYARSSLDNPILITLSVLFTLPHFTLDCSFIQRYINTIDGKKNNADRLTYAIKHLLSNPHLNASELKTEAIRQILIMLRKNITSATQLGNHSSIIEASCNWLLTLKNDDATLFEVIELINAQKNRGDAQHFFDHLINHPCLTKEQGDELTAKTEEWRQREYKDRSLLSWPEPITPELLQKPSVRTLQAAIRQEAGNVIDKTAPTFEFDEAFPHLPTNQTTDFQYDQLPLALLNNETFEGGMILTETHILPLPLLLFVLRNRQFNPTYDALYGENLSNPAYVFNITIFALLGQRDDVFNLPANERYCLDSYTDTIIRLMINPAASRPTHRIYESGLVSYLDNRSKSARATTMHLMEFAGIQYKINYHNELRINYDHTSGLYKKLYTALKKHLTVPGIRSAFYQKIILDEPCLMHDLLFNTFFSTKEQITDELKGTPVTPATLNTLRDTLTKKKTTHFRLAILFMAFASETTDPEELNNIIRQHLLNKTLTGAERGTLIEALKLLDKDTFTALKRTIVAWFTQNSDHCSIAQQRIHNHSGENNPLLLTLMIECPQYTVKETSHYKQLIALIGTSQATKKGAPEQELLLMHSAPNPEEDTQPSDIKEKSRAFIAAAFRGDITWSNTAPFLPLPGQAHLPLTQFSLAGISPNELWGHLLKYAQIPYPFLLFLLRHEETHWLTPEENHGGPTLPRYLVAFVLLGKNEAIFNLKADETHHLMSYQEAFIKYAIHLHLPSNVMAFTSKYNGYHRSLSTAITAALKSTHITFNTFNNVGYEDVIDYYFDCIKNIEPIAMALRQNELLNHSSLLMPDLHSRTLKYLHAYGPTEETLAQLQANIADPAAVLGFRIQCLVLYIAFSSETASVKDDIEKWLIKPSLEECHYTYDDTRSALKKLGPTHIAHLKKQINEYCAEQKNNALGETIKTALEINDWYRSPFLLLLRTGQNSGEIQPSGHYLSKLTLFYQDKAIGEKDAVKYGLAPKPGPQ